MYKKKVASTPSFLSGPILKEVALNASSRVGGDAYPFCLDLIKNFKTIKFNHQVTFFVGENGSGKSTLLEAIAHKAGFGLEGGSKNISFKTARDITYDGVCALADQLTLSWRQKVKDGYFFRAESFYNLASYIDELVDGYGPYGGKSLHHQSHGESFFAFFRNRVGAGGFYIFDEPEAALSPQRQLALLSVIHQQCAANMNTQFIIATHSPLLLAYPDAPIYSCDGGALHKIAYEDTEHYRVTKQFLDNPGLYLRHLLAD